MNVADEIEKLVKLRDRGVLTEEEFQELKAETLGIEKPSALVKTDNNTKETKIETAAVVTDDPVSEEEYQESEPETLGAEEPSTSVENETNAILKNIKTGQQSVFTDVSIEKPSLFKNTWVKALSALMAVIACVSIGIWIARQNNEGSANTTSENKTEAAQKQAAADAEFAKMQAKLDKLEAAYNSKSNSTSSENPNTNATPENKVDTNPTTAPQETQAPTVTEKEAPPITEVENPEKTTPTPPTSTKELIQYSSDATPFVLQMLDSARDTEKLFVAKSGLEGLEKPAKGERKAARKLNDSAITLMGEKKYTEAIPILEDAHKTDPADIEIMNNLAYAYIEKGIVDNDFAKAKQSLVDTLHLKPERAQAWANLGRTFALEGNESAASNCYINFFRFAENKEKALSRLQSGINETNPVLGKALTNAYNYVKTNIEPTSNSEAGGGE